MRQLYDRATRAYDVGKYAEAIDFYQKAYEIGGDPPMLYNIAQSYRLNDQPADAVRFYKRYLQRAQNPRNKDDVEKKIAELEKVVEERKKTAPPPPPAPVTPVTPAPATPPPAPVQPNPPSTTPGESGTTTPGESTTPATPPTPVEAEGAGTRRIVGWSLVGVGAAAGIGAVVAGLIAKNKSDKVTNGSQSMGKTMFDPTWESGGKNANRAMIGLAIGGGAAAVAGVILVITASSSSDEAKPAEAPAAAAQAQVAPWVGGGVVGAGATLRF
jgi:hypothetical protein